MKEDLVKELRAFGTNGFMMQAADEIERYKKALAAQENWSDFLSVHNTQLTKERDDARIQFCMVQVENDMYNKVMSTPEQVASEYGWDYLIPLMENK